MISHMTAATVARVRALLLAGALGLGLSVPASAHPHVFIEAKTKVLFEKGAFAGVQHRWIFDEFYTATAIEGLDANKDGVYSREELAELAKVNIDGLKEFNYFTFATVGGKDVKVGDAKDYWLEHKDGILTLVFTLPFAEPVAAEAKGFRLGVADPTFFIGFDWAKADAVTLGDGAPAACKVTFGVPAIDPGKETADEAALRGAFAQQFGNNAAAADRTAGIDCGPK